jgi:hypothetical protein
MYKCNNDLVSEFITENSDKEIDEVYFNPTQNHYIFVEYRKETGYRVNSQNIIVARYHFPKDGRDVLTENMGYVLISKINSKL